jgi:hypothetical protein
MSGSNCTVKSGVLTALGVLIAVVAFTSRTGKPLGRPTGVKLTVAWIGSSSAPTMLRTKPVIGTGMGSSNRSLIGPSTRKRSRMIGVGSRPSAMRTGVTCSTIESAMSAVLATHIPPTHSAFAPHPICGVQVFIESNGVSSALR